VKVVKVAGARVTAGVPVVVVVGLLLPPQPAIRVNPTIAKRTRIAVAVDSNLCGTDSRERFILTPDS